MKVTIYSFVSFVALIAKKKKYCRLAFGLNLQGLHISTSYNSNNPLFSKLSSLNALQRISKLTCVNEMLVCNRMKTYAETCVRGYTFQLLKLVLVVLTSDPFQIYICFYNSVCSFFFTQTFDLFLSCFVALLNFDEGPPFTLQRLCEVSKCGCSS